MLALSALTALPAAHGIPTAPPHTGRPVAAEYARRISPLRKPRPAQDPAIAIGDPRVEGWETVSTFEDQATAIAWRDQLRGFGIDAVCSADHRPDRNGRGDIYLVVPPGQWSQANEVLENLD